MILALLNTIFESLSDILYKKALSISDIKPTFFQFSWELISIPLIGIMIFLWGFDFGRLFDPVVVGGFALLVGIFVLHNNLGQQIYKEERMSALLPYTRINNFIVIIVWFLFLRDASWISFVICLGAVILTTTASIEWKEFTIPKNLPTILVIEVLKASDLLLSAYMLTLATNLEYIIIIQIVYLIGITPAIWWKGEFSEFRKFTPRIAGYRWAAYLAWFTTFVIESLVLKEYGVVITTLFGFFGSGLSLGLAFLLLQEVPKKKEIILWIVMILLAGAWYYFR